MPFHVIYWGTFNTLPFLKLSSSSAVAVNGWRATASILDSLWMNALFALCLYADFLAKLMYFSGEWYLWLINAKAFCASICTCWLRTRQFRFKSGITVIKFLFFCHRTGSKVQEYQTDDNANMNNKVMRHENNPSNALFTRQLDKTMLLTRINTWNWYLLCRGWAHSY